jgi:hypothetical protein
MDEKTQNATVLSLFTGICGMDLGYGGNVVVHKNSISVDFSRNICGNSTIL